MSLSQLPSLTLLRLLLILSPLCSYIVLNLPYMILHTILTSKTGPAAARAKLLRRTLGSSFFGALVPLVYYYLQHKQHRIAGGEQRVVLLCALSKSMAEPDPIDPHEPAYSIYALVEWSLIVLDVAFDSVAILDFPDGSNQALQISISYADKDLFSGAAAGDDGISRLYVAPAGTDAGGAPPGRLATALAKLDLATAGTRHFAADVYLGTQQPNAIPSSSHTRRRLHALLSFHAYHQASSSGRA